MRPRIALLAASFALAATLFPVARAFAQDCSTGASLRVLNLSPSSGAVDVLIGGQVVASNIAPSSASAFIPATAGTVSVQINQTGTTTAVVGPVDVTTTAGGRVTVAVLSQAAAAGGGQQPSNGKPTITTQVFQDDLAPPAAGLARVRVIQGSSDAAAVDVLAGTTVIVPNVAFGTASAFADVPAGTFPISVNTTGTTTSLGTATNLDLVAGRTYTIFVSGVAADKTVVANLLVDRAFDAQARFVHASPDAPAIDVIADGRAVVTNLAYPNATPYVALPAGGACVAVAPTGTTTPVIPAASLNLTSASKQTVIVLGQATGTPALSVGVFPDETTPPAADKAKVRVIHASPDTGPIDVLAADQVLISNVAFATASQFVEVAAGTISIKVNQTGTTTTLLGPIDLTVSGGQIITVIARGKNADKTLGLTLLSDVSGG
jgi:hypothetical protein